LPPLSATTKSSVDSAEEGRERGEKEFKKDR
jgi:hypothetical protein